MSSGKLAQRRSASGVAPLAHFYSVANTGPAEGLCPSGVTRRDHGAHPEAAATPGRLWARPPSTQTVTSWQSSSSRLASTALESARAWVFVVGFSPVSRSRPREDSCNRGAGARVGPAAAAVPSGRLHPHRPLGRSSTTWPRTMLSTPSHDLPVLEPGPRGDSSTRGSTRPPGISAFRSGRPEAGSEAVP